MLLTLWFVTRKFPRVVRESALQVFLVFLPKVAAIFCKSSALMYDVKCHNWKIHYYSVCTELGTSSPRRLKRRRTWLDRAYAVPQSRLRRTYFFPSTEFGMTIARLFSKTGLRADKQTRHCPASYMYQLVQPVEFQYTVNVSVICVLT